MSCAALTPRVVNTSSFRRCGARVRASRRSGWRLRCCRASLRLAVTEERIASDPVGLIEKPSSLPDGGLDPIPPAIVETTRRAAIARRGPLGAVDAFIVGLRLTRVAPHTRRASGEGC